MTIPAGPGPTTPLWRPTLVDVAQLVPNRTVNQAGTGDPVVEGTFTAATIPTAEQVEDLITDAVAEILAETGEVDDTLHDMARSCAKMRAAAKVQTAYPVADASYSYQSGQASSGADVGAVWAERADQCLTKLVAANLSVGGTPGPAAGPVLVPVWAFPDPVSWGDTDL